MTDAEAIRATETWAAPGKRVRVRGGIRSAHVVRVDNAYCPGAVLLDRRIGTRDGDVMQWWNVDSLVSMEPL